MKIILTIIAAAISFISVSAYDYDYSFHNTPISEALVTISKQHPDINISFIYKELDKYRTSAHIQTDNAGEALRKTVGVNPISVIERDGSYYIEAMQHGKFVYSGRAKGTDNEPVVGATVMLLEPKDSTTITYGITDQSGRFSIPCDRENVIAKFTCIGYLPTYKKCDSFSVGTVVMQEHIVKLGEVKVEAENGSLYADRSVYIPTSKQKNASQTGADLLNHMAIPQLNITSGNILTNSGKPVAVFIDYIPASETDLQAMRTADVKRVEFLEYPSDPRLQGNPYVINFIMQNYEYGGYVKGLVHTNVISSPVIEGQGNVRMQYKKMSYDLLGSVFNYDRKHIGTNLTETFRLPQENGEINEFKRHSELASSKERRTRYYTTFRATYTSDKVQAQSQIIGRIDRQPNTERAGSISYTPNTFPNSEYKQTLNDKSEYIAYKGYYFFVLPKNNTLTFNPSYSFSHTTQFTSYTEARYTPINNGASDNTNQVSGNLKLKHDFGKFGNLLGVIKGSYEYNHTRYSGTAVALDRAKSTRIGIAANYDITVDKVYGHIGFGWDWDRLQFGESVDRPSSPNFNFSLQYAPDKKNSVSAKFQYESWLPSPSFKSDKIIEASPLLSYTGNPALRPAKSYDIDFSYTWIPNNNFNLGAYAWAWIVGERYVYDYEATSAGVLRTIKQPMGSFAQGMYGVNGTLRLLDKSLVFSANIGHILNHNGKPYNVDHSHINWHARVRYYLDDWNFTLTYISDSESADGCMNGIWVNSKNDWYITVGWANDKWNLRGDIIDFTRWNWENARAEMRSKYYDTTEIKINGISRAFVQLVATYTFGFGKKVGRSDEPSVSGSASSGILK